MKIIIDEVSNRSWLLELKELFKNECKYQISDLIKAASSIANKYIGSDSSLIANELSHGYGLNDVMGQEFYLWLELSI